MNPVLRVVLIVVFCVESFGSSSKTNFVRVVFNTNASYEATIIWNQLSGEFIQLVMDKSYPDQNASSHSLSDENHYKGMDNHVVRLKNLEPNTRYYFYIEDSEGKNNIYYFTNINKH